MTDLSKMLIIEDSEDVVEAVSVALQIRWPQLKIISTGEGEEGLELVEKESPDIILLDLGLIDMSGFEVLKRIRLFSNIPVIILTVRGDEADVVKGLELGADEYIVKPFRQLELIARINAVARRLYATEEERPIACGQYYFDPSNRVVICNGRQVVLTRTESIVLLKLMQNIDIMVTHSKIAEDIWGNSYPEAAASIKVYIRRLRKKIEPDPNHPRLILTKPGLGYLFAKQA
ncbi:response regulator transcription factor [Chloroflexota bacterium]